MRIQALAVSSLLASASLLVAQGPVVRSEVEPNNDAATAQTFNLGDEVVCTLVAGELDWFTFTVPSAGKVELYLAGNTTSGGTTGTDTRMYLYDSTGTALLGLNDDAGGTGNFTAALNHNLQPGTYLVKVEGYSATDAGFYSFESSLRPLKSYTDSEASEPNDNSLRWRLAAPTTVPGARMNHAMAHDSARGRTVMFGGTNTSGIPTADTWEWDGSNWTLITPATSPSARSRAAMTFDSARGKVVMFGGFDGTNLLGDTWEWNGTNWAQITTAASPSGRVTAMAYDSTRNRTVLFGGGGTLFYLNDTWEYDGVNWTLMAPATTTPSGRLSESMAFDASRGKTVMYGGVSTAITFGETWEWSGTDWALVSTATVPPARSQHASFYATYGSSSRVYIVGGRDSAGASLGDMWEYNGTDWTQITPPDMPSARMSSAIAYDSNRGRAVLFGGNTGGVSTTVRNNQTYRFGVAATEIAGLDKQIQGDISVAGDADWYRFEVTVPTAGLWFYLTDGDTPGLVRSRLEFYTSSLALIGTTLGTNAVNSGVNTARSSALRTWPAGVYYVAVKQDSGSLDPLTGKYRLEVRSMDLGTGATVSETEPNDVVTSPNVVTLAPGDVGLGAVPTGSSTSVGFDLWRITLSAASTVTFQTDNGSAPALTDTTIQLLNADGSSSGITSLSGNTLAPSGTSHGRGQVRFNLTPNTYFLKVHGGTTTVSGNYKLFVGTMPSYYVDGSYTSVTANATCLGSNTLRPTIAVATGMSTRERPVLGTLFRRQVTQMRNNGLFFTVQGFSNTTTNGGSTPLPLALTGAPNCSLNVDPAFLNLGMASATGTYDWSIVMPATQSLRGIVLFDQVVALDPAANALGVTVSNYFRQIVGDRYFY